MSAVLDREIDLVGDQDVLAYDRPEPSTGLTWSALIDSWNRDRPMDAEEAKRSPWQRLLAGLSHESPPQRNLFTAYYSWLGARETEDFPALLTEVWLHWDHKTKTARGGHAMQTMRIDFLLLPGGNRRIVPKSTANSTTPKATNQAQCGHSPGRASRS